MNNKFKKIPIVSIISLLTLMACNEPTINPNPGDNNPETFEKSDVCNITLMSLLEEPIVNAAISLVDAENNVLTTATTDDEGKATLDVSNKEYTVSISNLDEKFNFDQNIKLSASDDEKIIKVPTKLLTSSYDESTHYTVGDVIHNQTFTTADNNRVTLSDVLASKKLIVFNFWATWCGPCDSEFPFLEEAYEKYKDDVEVIAISNCDTPESIIDYRDARGLTFPMCYEVSLNDRFGFANYPMSVFVDRYAMVTGIHKGAVPSMEDFEEIFLRHISDTYSPTLANENGQYLDIPYYTMPSSSAIEEVVSGEGFSFSFRNEAGEDALYNWPWIISEDGQSIHPSNARHANSYSIMYTDITLDENQVFAFDYFSSTEDGYDILYILVDREIVQQITGISKEWDTCYCYVPMERGTHEVAFAYSKDSAGNATIDTVYVKNMRIIDKTRIDKPTYIFQYAAYDLNVELHKYLKHVDVVLNEEDGYYHVDKVDGPILLANLKDPSHFSPTSIFAYMGLGDPNSMPSSYYRIKKYCQLITNYALYQNNSEVGLVPVTEELKNALIDITAVISGDSENEWYELCGFYQAYFTDEIPDPIKGLAPFSAYKGHLGENSVNFNRLIMPRGLLTSFTATESGVYLIRSITWQDRYQLETACWIFDENMAIIAQSDGDNRYFMTCQEPDPNFYVYVYLEMGKTYYINVAYENLDFFGDLVFNIENLHTQTYSYLTLVSPNYYTTDTDGNGEMTTHIIAGGLDVILNKKDGYYHVVLPDGTIGPVVYADFLYVTGIMYNSRGAFSIIDLINNGAFDFTKDINGNPVEDEEDKTEEMRAYYSKVIRTGEYQGLCPVDENLAVLLQKFMNKYGGLGFVEHSWTKLCYYMKTVSK